MSVAGLNFFISSATVAYRKGDEVTESVVGGIRVVEINGYPLAPDSQGVDVHFLTIGFTPHANEITAEEFLDMITVSEDGEFARMPLDRVRQGPSYIEYGAWLGSQDQALRFLALGQHYGLWTVITPAVLGIDDPQAANTMAGNGFVMNGGLDPKYQSVG